MRKRWHDFDRTAIILPQFDQVFVINVYVLDGWMNCLWFDIVFQLYQEAERVIMKGWVQFNLVKFAEEKQISPPAGIELGSVRSSSQRRLIKISLSLFFFLFEYIFVSECVCIWGMQVVQICSLLVIIDSWKHFSEQSHYKTGIEHIKGAL